MTNVEALKACYVAIGGSAADVADAKTTAAVIEAISTIASGGGGGGGVIVAHVTEDQVGLDITAGEVMEALGNSTPVFYIDYNELMGLCGTSIITFAQEQSGSYTFWVNFQPPTDPATFTASSASARLEYA